MSEPLDDQTAPTNEFTDVWEAIAACAEALNLQPGDQLPSLRALAEHVRAKPTVVRDALLQAQAKGAVRIVPRVGAYLQISPHAARSLLSSPEQAIGPAVKAAVGREHHNLLHLLDARRTIEVELIGRAAVRRQMEDLLPVRRLLESLLQLPADAPRPQYIELDLRFHAELARLAGNGVLAAILQATTDLLLPHIDDVMSSIPPNSEMRIVSDQYHASIYTAVAAGDAERARREMHEHLSVSYDYLLRVLQQPPTANPQ